MNQVQDELMHYGVLGMHWGASRAAKSGGNYSYKSHTTKKYAKKARKAKIKVDAYTEKAKEYRKRARKSAKLDKYEQDVSEKLSTGLMVAANLATLGTASATVKAYSRYRGQGESISRSALKSTMLISMPIAQIQKAVYIRKDDD